MSSFRERRAVPVSYPPSALARKVYGSVSKAASRLGIRTQSFYNYDRGMRLPYAVWNALRDKNPVLVDKVTTSSAHQMIGGPGYTLPTKLAPRVEAPAVVLVASTPRSETTLADRVSRLEQDNQTLRQQLTDIRSAIGV